LLGAGGSGAGASMAGAPASFRHKDAQMGIRSRTKNSGTRIKATKRRLEALRLREKELTYAQIGDEMGVSPERAWVLVDEAHRWYMQRLEDKADKSLHFMLRQLETIVRENWPLVLQRDHKATERVFQAMDRKMKLLGLDVPKATTANTTITLQVQEVLIE